MNYINHRFTLEVLTREFKSSGLLISAKNMLKNRQKPSDLLYRIDIEKVTQCLRDMLEIKNQNERTIVIDDIHRLDCCKVVMSR